MNAIKYLLTFLKKQDARNLATESSLCLVAALTYMLNGLCSRPEEGRCENALYNQVFTVSSEGSQGPRGNIVTNTLFLNDLTWGFNDIPVVGANIVQPAKEIVAQLYFEPFDVLMAKFSHARSNEESDPARRSNRHHHTPVAIEEPTEEDEDDGPLFDVTMNTDIAISNLKERLCKVPGGYDLGESLTMVDDDVFTSVNKFLEFLLKQAPLDYLSKAPNRKPGANNAYSSRAYAVLTNKERASGARVFMNNEMHMIFDSVFISVQIGKTGTTVWKQQCDYCWSDHKPNKKAQGWPQCTYFMMWINFVKVMEELKKTNELLIIRKAMSAKFDQLAWLPRSTSDKLWHTAAQKNRDKSCYHYPATSRVSDPGGPSIVLNPRHHDKILRALQAFDKANPYFDLRDVKRDELAMDAGEIQVD